LLFVDDLPVEVIRKRVKHLNLSVLGADHVRVSAPWRVPDAEIAGFVGARRDWIERHRDRLRRSAPTPIEDGATQRVWGRPIPVRVMTGPSRVWLDAGGTLNVRVPAGADRADRRRAMDRWLRRQVAGALPDLETRWSEALGVTVGTWTVRRMSSRWGSCNPETGRITLNLELAAEPPELLEYIVVHEMAHLREPGHGRRFQRLMDRHLPDWRHLRRRLNRLVADDTDSPAEATR
jgi:predicted metal-dependent hydrolase